MSILDKLLETDATKLEAHTKEFEIKRLTKLIGEKFVITCRPLTFEQVNHISEVSKNSFDTKVNSVLEGCRIEGKKLSDKTFLEKFNTPTAKDVVKKLFLPGEVSNLYEEISGLSGYGADVVKEIKN